MAYSELIKNFEKIRAYMREFYVYGFKSRSEFGQKSARSYDDERRRIESWLGDYMKFDSSKEGKNVFLSIDSRTSQENPLYKAWKAKSFTDLDITLHFIIFDILYAPSVSKSLQELIAEIDEYLQEFEEPLSFDESTVRKKLKEYAANGLIVITKQGRQSFYSRSEDVDVAGLRDMVNFFTEIAPCGVIGSFLQDRLEDGENFFAFKHHYITHALDSEVLGLLFVAMREHRYVIADNTNRKGNTLPKLQLLPLRVYISTQNGRQNLLAYNVAEDGIYSYRLDYLSKVKLGEVCPEFEARRAQLAEMEPHIWGVNCKSGDRPLDHVEMEIYVAEDEYFIIQRIEREKRCGKVERLDANHWRFTADVYDAMEMVPWLRTFICRITRLEFSDKRIEARFMKDLRRMYDLYEVRGEEHDFQ